MNCPSSFNPSADRPFPHRLVPVGQLVRPDAQFGSVFVPNIHRRVPHEHGAYFAVTNAQGFREDHDFDRLPPGRHVLCYGDSYTAGDGVDNSERFSALVADQLGITVSNAAVPGHGADQNLLQLESGALPRPDWILWCIAVHTITRIQSGHRFSIDRQGALRRIGRPHFVLDAAGELELRGVPVPDQGELLDEPPFPQIQPVGAARRDRLKAALRSRLAAALRPVLKSAPDPDYADPGSAGWRLMAALVRRFHRAAVDTPVALVPLPTSRYLLEGREEHFQRRFEELADPAAGLHVLDVISGLRRCTRGDRKKFNYRLDGHYTPSGHAAVASVLAEQLRAHRLVPEAARPSHVAVAAPERRRGCRLQVGWTSDDGHARLLDADATVLAEHTESEIAGHRSRAGVLPISAVNACLEAGRVAGPELERVELLSPCTLEDLIELRDGEVGRALRAGWVRWLGGAEVDLRKFLCYRGPLTGHSQGWTGDSGAVTPAVAPVDDDEGRWLHQCLAPFAHCTSTDRLEHDLAITAKRWELVTRASRESVLPTTAPLRRGRMAQRLARGRGA